MPTAAGCYSPEAGTQQAMRIGTRTEDTVAGDKFPPHSVADVRGRRARPGGPPDLCCSKGLARPLPPMTGRASGINRDRRRPGN